MPRKPEGAVLVLGLIAVLLSFTAAQATAPIAKDLPDIRSAINSSGSPAATVLDLDDYVVDPDDRNSDGVQNPLTWSQTPSGGDASINSPSNELQVSVPAQTNPNSTNYVFTVTDNSPTVGQDFVSNVVKTTTLLAAPLVDDFLNLGPANSAIPYSWCIDTSQTLRIEPGVQPGGGGRLVLSVSTGIGQTCFFRASSVLADATAQQNPISPYDDAITLKGLKWGTGSSVSLNAVNLSIDGGLSGLFVTAQTGFSDWVRVTLTRTYDDGSNDCYSVAIADYLTGPSGSAGNLSGAELSDPSVVDAIAVYGFDNGLTAEDLTGITDGDGDGKVLGADYDPGSTGSRANQITSWTLAAIGQTGTTLPAGTTLPDMEITSNGKPAATYPGATSGRALKMEFDQAANEGVLFTHKGINSGYAPGDIITAAMNIYVDLNYGAGNAAEINEASNGLFVAMALVAQPIANIGSFNYISFPITKTDNDNFNATSVLNGANHAMANTMAVLHGKWTRHQVSFRVPELGQNVTLSAGSGDMVDPNGISLMMAFGRRETGGFLPDQTVWLDNICISKCPGALALAHGAINVPIVSAGYSSTYFNGTDGTDPGGNSLGNLPAALARGAVINGNFSTVGDGSTNTVTASALPSVSPFGEMASNASKGWIDIRSGDDTVFIGEGGSFASLSFPDANNFNQALVLTPDLTGNYPTPAQQSDSAGVGHPGFCGVETPYIDMVLAAESVVPAVNVNTVVYADGTANGIDDIDRVEKNVSGVFGVRLFARTNASDPADNPSLVVILSDADVVKGLVGQYPPQVLPNGADALGSGVVWADLMVEGTIASFHSGLQYSFGLSSITNNSTKNALQNDNPGAQLALLQIRRTNPGSQDAVRVQTQFFNGYETTLGADPTTGTGFDETPGRNSTATVFVDEVGLYAVRDSAAFYDEDLCATAYLP